MSDHRAPEAGVRDSPAPGPVVDTAAVEGSAPGAKRPEPVLSAAKLAGAISGAVLAVGGLLKLLGVVVPGSYDLRALADSAGTAVLAVGTAWAVVGPWLTARIGARDKVTPITDPRSAAGERLTPEGT